MSDVSQAINETTGLPEVHLPVAVSKSAQELADHVAPLINLIPHGTRVSYITAFIGHLMGLFFHPKK